MTSTREKETILTMVVGCLVLYAIFSHDWMWMAALVVGVTGLVSDKLTRRIHVAWFWIAGKLGFVMSRVILGTLFLAILLPLALVAKFFRKDFMMLKNNFSSYFAERPHVYQRKDFENPW